jgi:hypothetical protein
MLPKETSDGCVTVTAPATLPLTGVASDALLPGDSLSCNGPANYFQLTTSSFQRHSITV